MNHKIAYVLLGLSSLALSTMPAFATSISAKSVFEIPEGAGGFSPKVKVTASCLNGSELDIAEATFEIQKSDKGKKLVEVSFYQVKSITQKLNLGAKNPPPDVAAQPSKLTLRILIQKDGHQDVSQSDAFPDPNTVAVNSPAPFVYRKDFGTRQCIWRFNPV